MSFSSESSIRLCPTQRDHEIARLTALALVFVVLEQMIPSPLPGVKPGIANIVTLILIKKYDFRTAAWVQLLRVIAGGLLFGYFLTPSFFLSLSGAIGSLFILFFTKSLPERYFSLITSSLLSSFAHIICQLLVVYFWLIPHEGLRYFLPIFATSAFIFGTINGIISSFLLKKIEQDSFEK